MSTHDEGSHVALEQHACRVCCTVFDTGAVLLDTRLRKTFKARHAVTAYGLCPACEKMRADGYVALIETRKHDPHDEGAMQAERTGRHAHIRASVWPRVFNVPAPACGFCYCEDGTLARLESMTGQSEQAAATEPTE